MFLVAGSSSVRAAKDFWCRSGDVEAAAQALARLAGDRALRLRLGAAANARFQKRFTVAAVKAVFADLYRSLLSVGASGAAPGAAAVPALSRPIEG
jgi:glycosyltransferase involved in cell wall biosynthesis